MLLLCKFVVFFRVCDEFCFCAAVSGRRTGSSQTESRIHRPPPSVPSSLATLSSLATSSSLTTPSLLTAPPSVETDPPGTQVLFTRTSCVFIGENRIGSDNLGSSETHLPFLLGSKPELKSAFHLFFFFSRFTS